MEYRKHDIVLVETKFGLQKLQIKGFDLLDVKFVSKAGKAFYINISKVKKLIYREND